MPVFNILKKSGLNDQKGLNPFFTKYYNLLVFLVAILIFVLGYYLLIQPKYNEIGNRKKITDQRQLEYSYLEKQAELNKFIELKRVYNKINQADKEKIKRILPSDAEVEKLIAEMESIVLSNGLILSSLSIQPAESSSIEGTVPVNISLTVVGVDYNNFKILLAAFENNLRLMDIKNLSYAEGKGGLNLNLVAYYQK